MTFKYAMTIKYMNRARTLIAVAVFAIFNMGVIQQLDNCESWAASEFKHDSLERGLVQKTSFDTSEPEMPQVAAQDASMRGVVQTGVPEPVNDHPVIEAAFTIGTINSMIIDMDGERIVERYEGRMHANRTTNIKSASKSILSLLVGIAIEEGYLTGTDQSVGAFFPDYFAANPDPVKEGITIQDLLTMRSGLESTSFQNYGRWVISSNWVEYVLNQPMEDRPGGEMIYSTGTSHLLSALLTEATGMSTLAFANRYLFDPLGIRVGGWDRDPQGYYMGGNNMALSPDDLMKIGRLMLDGGVYNGRQLVPEAWIEESVVTYTRSVFNPYDYGYMWWKKPVGSHEALFAWGNGGQYIILFRELDAVIVITSDLTRSPESRRYQRDLFDYLERELVPFLEAL